MARTTDDAVVLLDKPLGWTSNQALQKVKRLLQAKKAGHTGSLDPFATGLLPVCLGRATKMAQKLIDADKTYIAHIYFGASTTTGDPEGAWTSQNQPVPAKQAIVDILDQFLGHSQQIPPMYSAIKFQGQPLYKLARQGKNIDRPARNIHISKLDLLDYQNQQAIVAVCCSKGTYIRTLAEDIAKHLHTAAYLTALKRIRVGQLELKNARTIQQLETCIAQQKVTELLLDPQDCIGGAGSSGTVS